MEEQAEIKNKFERISEALTLKPSLGLGCGTSKTRIVSGLSCEITEGDWTFRTDMPEQVGGTATGPTPGVLGRAALGSCLAISYMMWASKMNIPIDSLEVEIQADYDDGALFGTSNTAPGYSEIRYMITIKSTATESEIESLLNIADRHSPYLDVFANAQNCIRQVQFIKA
ncbi:OsmC family protein [Flavobacterium chuncheonense]|uniref:OsmC family protein n=1 Tax=Flavobacterium chuncheonense TaxID=2026653 RepID=A0ABW5YQT4_9FLAO